MASPTATPRQLEDLKKMEACDKVFIERVFAYFPGIPEEEAKLVAPRFAKRLMLMHNNYAAEGYVSPAPARIDRIERAFFHELEDLERDSESYRDESEMRARRAAYYAIRSGNQHVLTHPYYSL